MKKVPKLRELDGMTINERLFACGAFAEFDAAAQDRNREKLISVLVSVGLPVDQATTTADALLLSPSRYGF